MQLGRRVRTRFNAVLEKKEQAQVKSYGGVDRTVQIGDREMAENFSSATEDKWVEGTVNVIQRVLTQEGNVLRRHTDQIIVPHSPSNKSAKSLDNSAIETPTLDNGDFG